MIRLTEIALRNKSVVLLIAVGLFLSGLMAWGSLRQELLPDIELPFVTVIAAQPGAGAEDVAQQVSVPIEQAIKSVPRLEALSSTSANSLSLVVAQFEYGTDIKDDQCRHRGGGRARHPARRRRAAGLRASTSTTSPSSWRPSGPPRAAIRPRPRASRATELLPLIRAIPGVSSADLTGGATQQLLITPGPGQDGRRRRQPPAGPGRPAGQPADHPGRQPAWTAARCCR